MNISKAQMKQIALIAGVAAIVVYASNNRLPLVGSSVRRAIG